MMPASMVSADSHVIEPHDLYEPLRREWSDRTPTVRRAADGTDWWWVDEQRTNSFAGGSQAGKRFDDADSLVLADSMDNVRVQVWTPGRYVDDNRGDGIGASVLYPTQQMQHYAVPNSALVSATCRVYNDWLAEFCGAHRAQLRGIAALNVDDPDDAAVEIERVAARDLAGALLPVALPRGQSYADPRFDRVWQAAADTALPLSFHIGTYRANPARIDRPVRIAGAQTETPRPVQSGFATADLHVRQTLADLIFGGVLERHRGLRVVSAEHEIGWFAHFVERMDYTYTQRATKGLRFAGGALPSDFVRRQVWVQFCEDPLAAMTIDRLGPHNVLWGCDYPHSEGTYPRSRETAATLLAPCSDDDRQAVLVDNPASLYGLDAAALEP